MVNSTDLNVLIVEDDADIGKMLQLNLAKLGIDAYHALNGQHAIDYLADVQPDLILLDLNLPHINGWKVLEYAKKLYGDGTFHVIVITANSDEVNRLVGKMQSVTHYVQKPFMPDYIIDVVIDILQIDPQ